MAKRKQRLDGKLTAAKADRYVLYTEAVQSTDYEIALFTRVFRKEHGRPPLVLREDFCGTAAISCDWVKAGGQNRAIGVDLDPEPLEWGREHYVSQLSPDQRRRVKLLRADVLKVRTEPVDVIAALNFSFCVFKQRSVLVNYLARCRAALNPGGIMLMDIYGGPDSQKPCQEKTRYRGFTYIWDQAVYNPATNGVINHIHFLFPDGTSMKRAFTYDWRLWTPMELVEAMQEAGFSEVRTYWEGTTKDGKSDGVYRPRTKVPSDPAWIAYIVGLR